MTSTLLFAATIVAAIGILILLFRYIGNLEKKKQTEKQNNYFTRAAEAFGISVQKKDMFRYRSIGCDASIRKLIYVDYSEEPYRHSLVELKNMSGSKIIVNIDNVTENVRGEERVIDRITSSIQLNVHFKNNTFSPVILTIYKYGIDSQQDMLHLKKGAEFWNELINKNCG